jgi:hypothetical protein
MLVDMVLRLEPPSASSKATAVKALLPSPDLWLVDENLDALNFHRISMGRLASHLKEQQLGLFQIGSITQIELGIMILASDHTTLERALLQRLSDVRTLIVHGVETTIGIGEKYSLPGYIKGFHLSFCQFLCATTLTNPMVTSCFAPSKPSVNPILQSEVSAQCLFSFYGLKQSLEIPLAKTICSFALDDFEEQSRTVFHWLGENLKQIAV